MNILKFLFSDKFSKSVGEPDSHGNTLDGKMMIEISTNDCIAIAGGPQVENEPEPT